MDNQGLVQAINKKHCVFGIENVWRTAVEKRGKTLIVEKDYACKAKLGIDKYTLVTEKMDLQESNVLKNAVIEIINLVLKDGGEIAFVDRGELSAFHRIALITYF